MVLIRKGIPVQSVVVAKCVGNKEVGDNKEVEDNKEMEDNKEVEGSSSEKASLPNLS